LLGEARSDYAWSGQVISGYIVLGRVMLGYFKFIQFMSVRSGYVVSVQVM